MLSFWLDGHLHKLNWQASFCNRQLQVVLHNMSQDYTVNTVDFLSAQFLGQWVFLLYINQFHTHFSDIDVRMVCPWGSIIF